MSKYYHPDSDYYRKVLKTEAPKSTAHLTEEELERNMERLMPNSWTLKGNLLEGMTSRGRLVQTIPTSHILVGTDTEGLPVFKKIELGT